MPLPVFVTKAAVFSINYCGYPRMRNLRLNNSFMARNFSSDVFVRVYLINSPVISALKVVFWWLDVKCMY